MKIPKHLPLPRSKFSMIDEIVRVDHAGEYGAKRIYEGQLAVLKQEDALEIRHMYQQELQHLEYFQGKLSATRSRPTFFYPLWHALAFALGAATASMGKKAAMACTVAVEDVIESHYQTQINQLQGEVDENLLENITQFREEEISHRNTGIKNQAHEIWGYNILYRLIHITTRTAIMLSKKI